MATLAPSKNVTSRDEKGLKFIAIVEAAYNKAKLSEDEAQHVNNTPGLADLVKNFIADSRLTDRFKDEEVKSKYAYPKEYKGPKPISQQIDALAKIFGLSLGFTSDYAQKVLPTLTIPDNAEGWFAIPSVDAVARVYFPQVTDPAERYCHAVQLVHEKIKASRSFYNYRDGEITPDHLRVHARTAQALNTITEQQQGDILIIPAQFGMRHRGRSVRRAREVMSSNEFGLTSFAVGCMALVHPERFVRWEELDVDCAGDEFSPDADGSFGEAPDFHFYGGRFRFDTGFIVPADDLFGAASGFVPQ